MENKFYVYVIYRKDNNKPFYVGKGTGQRCGQWYNRNERYNKIRDEFGAYHKIVFNNLTEEEAYELEEQTILELSEFYELTNIAKGGIGGNLGLKMDDNHKSKVSQAVQRQWDNPETRARLIESRRRNHARPEVRKKMSESHKGLKQSEEHKKAISNALKNNEKVKKSRLRYNEAKVYDKEMNIICEFDTVQECVDYMNLNFNISFNFRSALNAISEKRKTYKGYIWKANKFR